MRPSPLTPSEKSELRDRGPFDTLKREIENLINRPFRSFSNFNPTTFSDNIDIDVIDKEKELIIKADIPGINEKDISIDINNGVLTIKGKRSQEKKEEQQNYYMMERSYGEFSRSFQLPFQVDANEAKAELDDGVLTLTLPKPKDSLKETQKIKIKKK